MGSDKWAVVTIGSLLESGAITAHKDGNYGSQYPRVEEFGSVGIPFLTAKSLKAGRSTSTVLHGSLMKGRMNSPSASFSLEMYCFPTTQQLDA